MTMTTNQGPTKKTERTADVATLVEQMAAATDRAEAERLARQLSKLLPIATESDRIRAMQVYRMQMSTLPIVIRPQPTPNATAAPWVERMGLERHKVPGPDGQPVSRLHIGGMAKVGSTHQVRVDAKPMHVQIRQRSGEPVEPFCLTHGVGFKNEGELAGHTAEKAPCVTAWRVTSDRVFEQANVNADGSIETVPLVGVFEADE